MVEGKVEQEWNHTAMICCLQANINRDPKKSKEFTLADFHPYMTNKANCVIEDSKTGFNMLKKLFVKQADIKETPPDGK
jgi:hypothetical protein